MAYPPPLACWRCGAPNHPAAWVCFHCQGPLWAFRPPPPPRPPGAVAGLVLAIAGDALLIFTGAMFLFVPLILGIIAIVLVSVGFAVRGRGYAWAAAGLSLGAILAVVLGFLWIWTMIRSLLGGAGVPPGLESMLIGILLVPTALGIAGGALGSAGGFLMATSFRGAERSLPQPVFRAGGVG